jgi:hypothetical protein
VFNELVTMEEFEHDKYYVLTKKSVSFLEDLSHNQLSLVPQSR